MTVHREAQMIIAHWLCGDGDGQPCASHLLDGEIAVRALALAGYLKTDGGVVGSGGQPPSAGAGDTAPPSPYSFLQYEWRPRSDPHYGKEEGAGWFHGNSFEHVLHMADLWGAELRCRPVGDWATFAPPTDDGAGETPPATCAVSLDPAAQAGQAPAGAPAPPSLPRRFALYRHEDPSGVSGVGWVAEGVQFTDGAVALRWPGEHACTVPWDGIARIDAVHGHNGLTEIRWLDGDS